MQGNFYVAGMKSPGTMPGIDKVTRDHKKKKVKLKGNRLNR